MDQKLLWEEKLSGFSTWTHVLKRKTAIKLTALARGANVAAIFLNADLPAERLNLPDTLKAQHTARLTAGHVLFSDMGRVLCSIAEDTTGWHDPLSGFDDAASVARKYGALDYQTARNAWHQNPLDAFTNELLKLGLTSRDMTLGINFFSRVDVSSEGEMKFAPNNANAGSSITLRAEMNTLCVLVNCQHPLDPNTKYEQAPVKLELFSVTAPTQDDLCRNSSPEANRGFILTERYFI